MSKGLTTVLCDKEHVPHSTHSCPFIATAIVHISTFPGHNVNIPGAHTIPGTAITIPALSSESLSQSMACGANQCRVISVNCHDHDAWTYFLFFIIPI